MFEVTKFPHGTFSWADCSSTDQAGSKVFYKGLLGWDCEDMPMGDGQFYTMFKKDGKYVAGLGPMQPEQMAQGHPSYWTSYINVDDVDALVPRITALGGNILMPAMDVFDSGRMLLLRDPSGAIVGLWQAKNHSGAQLVNTTGAMCWNELMTPEPQKAMDFYGALFGWTFEASPGNSEYYTISNNGRPNGGILKLSEEMGAMPPLWAVYFTVDDVHAAVEQIKALGGAIHLPVTEAAEVGHFTMFGDSAGAICYAIQMDQPQPWDLN